jgi:hypothetical protein
MMEQTVPKEMVIKITGANLFAKTQIVTWLKKAATFFGFEYRVEDIG